MFRVHTPIIRNIRCAVPCTIRTVNATHTAALKTTTHTKNRCRKRYAATQHLMLLMMGVCTRNMSSLEYINKITLLHQVVTPHYFIANINVKKQLVSPQKIKNNVEGFCVQCCRISWRVWVVWRFLDFVTSYPSDKTKLNVIRLGYSWRFTGRFSLSLRQEQE